jgi:hypothetical protein
VGALADADATGEAADGAGGQAGGAAAAGGADAAAAGGAAAAGAASGGGGSAAGMAGHYSMVEDLVVSMAHSVVEKIELCSATEVALGRVGEWLVVGGSGGW